VRSFVPSAPVRRSCVGNSPADFSQTAFETGLKVMGRERTVVSALINAGAPGVASHLESLPSA
jgi:hypothetical protein